MTNASIKPSTLLADHGFDVGAVVLTSSPVDNIQGNYTPETSLIGGTCYIFAYYPSLKTALKLSRPALPRRLALRLSPLRPVKKLHLTVHALCKPLCLLALPLPRMLR
jgi:hypothetical protein